MDRAILRGTGVLADVVYWSCWFSAYAMTRFLFTDDEGLLHSSIRAALFIAAIGYAAWSISMMHRPGRSTTS